MESPAIGFYREIVVSYVLAAFFINNHEVMLSRRNHEVGLRQAPIEWLFEVVVFEFFQLSEGESRIAVGVEQAAVR